MMHFLSSYPCDTIPNTRPPQSQNCNLYTEFPTPECPDDAPTLQVKREKGDFTITYKPLKDAKNLKAGECPYMECPPLQIKIAKDEEGKKLDDCRKFLLKLGFQPCVCPSVKQCTCYKKLERENLGCEMKKLSREVGLSTPMKFTDFTTKAMAESKDLDYAFTPLAAMTGKKPKTPKKDTRATETQYNKKDYELPLPADRDLIKKGKDDGKGKCIPGPGKICKPGAGKGSNGKGAGGKGAGGKNGAGAAAGGKDEKGAGKGTRAK